MFNLVSPIMSFADRAYFQVWLSENTDKNLACYQFSGSVLKADIVKIKMEVQKIHLESLHHLKML